MVDINKEVPFFQQKYSLFTKEVIQATNTFAG